MSIYHKKVSNGQAIKKREKEELKVVVTEVFGGGKFYVQSSGNQEVASIQQELASLKLQEAPMINGSFNPKKGDLVLAEFSGDHSWNLVRNEDGVDLMSLSLGFIETPFYENPIALGAFAAMEKGIFVACSAGNGGPHAYTVLNGAPWITAVGAGTVDREFTADVTLGEGSVHVTGKSVYPENLLVSRVPIYYGHGNRSMEICEAYSLDPKEVEGKYIFCDFNSDPDADPLFEMNRTGAAGAIYSSDSGQFLMPQDFNLPFVVMIPKFLVCCCYHPPFQYYRYFIIDAAMSLPPDELIQIFGASIGCGFGFQTSFDDSVTARRRHQPGIEEWEVNQEFAEFHQCRVNRASNYTVDEDPILPITTRDTFPLPRKALRLPFSVGDSYFDADDSRDIDTLPHFPTLVIRCREQYHPKVKFHVFVAAITHHFRFQCIDT